MHRLVRDIVAVRDARIPLADPRADLASKREAIMAAIANVVDQGSYILGPEVQSFEGAMARRSLIPLVLLAGAVLAPVPPASANPISSSSQVVPAVFRCTPESNRFTASWIAL